MKFGLSILVYILMGLAIAGGILLLINGKPWFFVAALVIYVVAFAKIGCLTH